MKLTRAGLVFLFVALTFVNTSMAGQAGKFGLGIMGSYYDVTDSSLPFTDLPSIDIQGNEFNPAFMIGFNLNYFINDTISMELGISRVESNTDLKINGDTIDIGDLDQTPIMLTMRYHFQVYEKFIPYAGVGIGYYCNDFNVNRRRIHVEKFHIDDSMGFHFNAGCEYFFLEKASISADMKYIWNRTDVTINLDGTLVRERMEEVNMDAISIGVGLTYYFK